jgi:glucosyl-dolichyl phosphate glucuronosyltransferase
MKRIKDIWELLDSIAAQTYSNIETVLVVEHSNELYNLFKDYISKIPKANFKLVFNDTEFGLAANRNLGIKEAGGNIIAFVDDDAVLFPNWAEAMVQIYDNDESVIGVTGPILPLWEDASMNWFPKEFYWMFSCTYYDSPEPMEVRNGYGTNISFRREAFDLSGLFLTQLGAKGGGGWLGKQKLTGEETEFSIRVKRKTGKRIIYHPDVSVYHKVYKYRIKIASLAWRGFELGYTKAMFNRVFNDKSNKDKVLNTEYKLLKRVFVNLIPDILKGLFRHPVVALRKSCVTMIVLSSVTVGFLYCFFTDPFNKKNILQETMQK